ncbi:hypothetical protein [Roseimaritima multifibrata]|uniref:hypothetical protein n=1 Tax=Roseimaritima multifibrata TaxID=1930274 RepID=UPI0011A465FD|nr:hypothetical protein [Roseimaritima multifibrata]
MSKIPINVDCSLDSIGQRIRRRFDLAVAQTQLPWTVGDQEQHAANEHPLQKRNALCGRKACHTIEF